MAIACPPLSTTQPTPHQASNGEHNKSESPNLRHASRPCRPSAGDTNADVLQRAPAAKHAARATNNQSRTPPLSTVERSCSAGTKGATPPPTSSEPSPPRRPGMQLPRTPHRRCAESGMILSGRHGYLLASRPRDGHRRESRPGRRSSSWAGSLQKRSASGLPRLAAYAALPVSRVGWGCISTHPSLFVVRIAGPSRVANDQSRAFASKTIHHAFTALALALSAAAAHPSPDDPAHGPCLD